MAFKSAQATHAVELLLCEGLTVQGDDTVCDCTLPIHLPFDCTENTPEQWHSCAWPSTQRQSFGFKCFARQSAQGSRFDPLQIDAGHARRRMIRPRQVICRRYQHLRWRIPIELLLAQLDYFGQPDSRCTILDNQTYWPVLGFPGRAHFTDSPLLVSEWLA